MKPIVESITDKQFHALPGWSQYLLLLSNWILFSGGIVSTLLGLIFVFRGKLQSTTIKIWFTALFVLAIPIMISILFALHVPPSSMQSTVLNFAEPRLQIFDKLLLVGLSIFTGMALFRPASYGQNTWRGVIETCIAMGICFLVSPLSWIIPATPIDFLLMTLLMMGVVGLGFMWWRMYSSSNSSSISSSTTTKSASAPVNRQLQDVTATVVSMNALALVFMFFYVLERYILSASSFKETYAIVLSYMSFSEVALRGLCLLWIAEFRDMFRCNKLQGVVSPAPLFEEKKGL